MPRAEWWATSESVGISVHNIAGHHWARFMLSRTGRTQPGHRWMYEGCVRRDAWRLGRFGVIAMRMPRQTATQAAARVTPLADQGDLT